MNEKSVQLTIRGLVQGVGYRYFCYRTAVGLGLTGKAQNLPDGTVLVEAEGGRGELEILIKELKVGPMHASVSEIDVLWDEASGKHKSFEIW
ncbi:MAG: acylphosphatase [bacterium]|nr:acylphosphatase [bacterium]